MTDQNQPGSAAQFNKKNRPKTKASFAPERTEAEIGLAQLPVEPLGVEAAGGRDPVLATLLRGSEGVFGGGSFENQVARLDDSRLATVQRQALAAQIGRRQGNHHLQSVVGLCKRPYKREPETAKLTVAQKRASASQPRTSLTPEIWDCLPSWMKKRVNQQPALRNVLLILYARIGASLWKYIPKESITSITLMGVIEFKLQDHNALKKALKDKGYTDAFMAKASNNVWGLRESSDVSVAGLHWRGLPGGKVNVHIDLHPPRWWPGLWHAIRDYVLPYKLGIKPTLADVQAGVESLGIEIPVLHQQKVHGKLTVRLNDLESRAKGQPPAAQAEIDEGRGYLRQAASIIWNRDVISQAELKKAIWYLVLAEACASGAEHNLKSKR